MTQSMNDRPLLFTHGRVLQDAGLQDGLAIRVERGRIVAVEKDDALPHHDAEVIDLQGGLLSPGFIDVQVNGGGDVLFNDTPTLAGVTAIAQAHRRFGTTGLLPTLISDRAEVMRQAIAATREAMQAGVPGVLGIHLEGPYLAPDRRGVHDAGHFLMPGANEIELVSSLEAGVTLVTLAPDRVPPEMIAQLVARKVIVALGHTAADFDQVNAALAAGASGFTHLFNAMTPLRGRAPGVVGAALDDARSWCGIIVDNEHVHPASVRIAHAAKPQGKLLLVTDAMPPVGGQNEVFILGDKEIRCVDGRCSTAEGGLAGSGLDMASAVRNTVELGIPLDEALRMASTYPAEFLGMGDIRGRINVGQAADLVWLDPGLNVVKTWIAGT